MVKLCQYLLMGLAIALCGQIAFAQDTDASQVLNGSSPTTSTLKSEQVEPITEPGDLMIAIDLVPSLISAVSGNPGGGLFIQSRIGSNMGIGLFGSISEFNEGDEEDSLLFYQDRSYQQTSLGAEVRIYMDEFGKGLYGSAGFARSELRARANAEPINAANFKVEDRLTDSGFIGRVGYSFSVPKKTFRRFIVDLAIEYGPGNEWTTRGDSTGEFELLEYTSSINFNASMGATF